MAVAAHKVVIIEDDLVLREHLRSMIGQIEDFVVCGEADSVAEGRELFSDNPAVALIDLDLVDGSGLDLIAEAKQAAAEIKIVVVTVLADERAVLQAFDAGADGFLLKDGPVNSIEGALRDVMAGRSPISAAAATHLLRRVRRPSPSGRDFNLTKREIELLRLLAKGLSNVEVGECLGISPLTVSTHAKAIYRKMQVRSRSEAVFEAVNEGLIRFGE